MIVQRRAKVYDGRQQRHAEDRRKPAVDRLQPLLVDHIGEYRGKGDAHQHVVERDSRKDTRVEKQAEQIEESSGRQTGRFLFLETLVIFYECAIL